MSIAFFLVFAFSPFISSIAVSDNKSYYIVRFSFNMARLNLIIMVNYNG